MAAAAHSTPERCAVVLPFPEQRRQLVLFRLCANCGRPLSAYNVDDDELCQTCRRRWQEQTAYDPRSDPTLLSRLAGLLLANYHRPVHVGRELGIDVWVAGEAVKILRRRWGFRIVAHKGVPGYTLMGWEPTA